MQTSEKYDIEKYRKKKKRKQLFRRLLIIGGVLIVALVVYCIFEAISQNSSFFSDEENEFPVSLQGVNPSEFLTTSQGLVVVGDFCSLTPEQVRTYKQKFFRAELLVGIIDDEPVTLKVAPRIKGHPSKQRDPPDRTAR